MTTLLTQLPRFRYQQYILVILVFLAYGRSLSNGYSLDDVIVTTEQQSLVSKGLAGIPEIFLSPYGKGFDGTDSFDYRPVPLWTFAIEKAIFGFSPAAGHLVNLLLYIGLVLLVFSLFRRLLADFPEWIPFVIAGIFALHPLHSEVVLSLKNREEILVSLFGFGALHWCLKFFEQKRKWHFLLFASLCVLLGGNSKLTYGPFIYFIPVTLLFFKRISLKEGVALFLGLTVVGFVALYGPRAFIEGGFSRQKEYFENPLLYMTFADRIPMAFYSFLLYLKLHLWPYPLLSYYGFNHVEVLGWGDYQVYLGVILFLLLLFVAFRAYNKHRLLTFGILCFGMFIGPYLNFPVLATGIVAERFAFNSVLGFGIILTALIYSRPLTGEVRTFKIKTRKYWQIGLLTMSLIFLALNFSRAADWKSIMSLVEADSTTAPKSVKLRILYGDVLQEAAGKTTNTGERTRLIQKCIEAYRSVIAIYPDHADTYNNLGVAYSVSGQYKQAIPLIKKAIALGKETAENYYNLGACYEISGDQTNAVKYYELALEKNKAYTPAQERIKVIKPR